MLFEFKVSYEASSSIHFDGDSDWQELGEFRTIEEAEDYIHQGAAISIGLEAAIEASGFGWNAEVREIQKEEE